MPTAARVYRRTHKKGDRVGIPVNGVGKVYVKIYINGDLEKELDF